MRLSNQLDLILEGDSANRDRCRSLAWISIIITESDFFLDRTHL